MALVAAVNLSKCTQAGSIGSPGLNFSWWQMQAACPAPRGLVGQPGPRFRAWLLALSHCRWKRIRLDRNAYRPVIAPPGLRSHAPIDDRCSGNLPVALARLAFRPPPLLCQNALPLPRFGGKVC